MNKSTCDILIHNGQILTMDSDRRIYRPGAVATALRHVWYQKQARSVTRSASDTRPHRDVPVTDAHRSRSLTCILTTDNDAALAHSSAQCSTHTTLYRHE